MTNIPFVFFFFFAQNFFFLQYTWNIVHIVWAMVDFMNFCIVQKRASWTFCKTSFVFHWTKSFKTEMKKKIMLWLQNCITVSVSICVKEMLRTLLLTWQLAVRQKPADSAHVQKHSCKGWYYVNLYEDLTEPGGIRSQSLTKTTIPYSLKTFKTVSLR